MKRKQMPIVGRVLYAMLAVAIAASSFLAVPVSALSIPSPSKVARQMEERYHIDRGSMQNLGEEFNVASNKKYAPEVSIVFSPNDPKEGQRVTAKAFPLYFSNPNDQLYYTWLLKRQGCELGSAAGKPSYCNADGAGGITVNDWKVAASRIIAADGADKAAFSYRSNNDDDGYDAEYGGAAEIGTANDWCYLHDASNGVFYELATSESTDQFNCPSDGFIPACVSGDQNVASDMSSTYEYTVSGNPACVADRPSCPEDTLARCVNPDYVGGTFSLAVTEDNLTCESGAAEAQRCVHLFPEPSGTGQETGDGRFSTREEFFWGTNPSDPDTADNGNKDEANVVGLGMDSFTWNYQTGDLVGVAVEGKSMIPTKHDDSSMMIMWAFSGDECRIPNERKSSYNTVISGYSVNIPSVSMSEDDLNECLERDLVDPLLGGQGRSKRLEVDVAATPDNPTNDQTEERSGDVVNATATLTNSDRHESEILYEWTVQLGENAIEWGGQDAVNVTERLSDAGLLPAACRLNGSGDAATCSGNGLSNLPITLNMDRAMLGDLADVNPMYMRISIRVSENYGGIVARTGRSDVIVRVTNTDRKILPYVTGTVPNGSSYKVTLADSNAADGDPMTPICGNYHSNPTTVAEAADNLDRVACRVVKNEIIGLRVDNDDLRLRDFRWTVDGVPLSCNANVSDDADCAANGNEVFFAVVGGPGTTISAKLDAVDVESGRAVSLTRMFSVVEPEIVLESGDAGQTWPRYVGQYTDLDGNAYEKYSSNFFEKYPGSPIALRARFIPNFAQNISSRSWDVDGVDIVDEVQYATEVGTFFGVDAAVPELPVGSVHNVNVSATLVQPAEKRIALRDIWGIQEIGSAEVVIGNSVQVQNVAYAEAAMTGTKRFFAALSGYVPPVVGFAVRAILSGGLLLFAVGFAFSFVPETAPARSGRGK